MSANEKQPWTIDSIKLINDPLTEGIYKALEQVELIEARDIGDCIISTGSSCSQSPEDQPSQPLSQGAIRAINSVVRAKVRESAILKDGPGEF